MDITQLTDDCLARIFLFCELDQRLTSLPLVCKRFNCVLDTPSLAWSTLDIAVDRLCSVWNAEPFDAAQLQRWFEKRGKSVTAIEVTEGDCEFLCSMCTNVVPYVRTALKKLSLFNSPLPSRYVSLLKGCTSLAELELTVNLDDSCWQKHLAQLSSLTSLRNLEIEFDVDDSVESFPAFILELTNLVSLSITAVDGIPSGLTQLMQLTRLRAELSESEPFPEPVVELTQLAELHLRWATPDERVAVPAAIADLRALRALCLEGSGSVAYDVAPVGALTGLTSLKLNFVALSEVPEWLAGFTDLQELWLQHNLIFEIPPWLHRLPALRTLIAAPQLRPLMAPGEADYDSLGMAIDLSLAKCPSMRQLQLTSRLGPVYHLTVQVADRVVCLLHSRQLTAGISDACDEAWELEALLPKGGERGLAEIGQLVAFLHRVHRMSVP